MIKTALKHWIYEMCINQIFNAFWKNFILPKKDINIRKGNRYYKIQVNLKDSNIEHIDIMLYECHILDVIQGTTLIAHRAIIEYDTISKKIIHNRRYGKELTWRVNLDDITTVQGNILL